MITTILVTMSVIVIAILAAATALLWVARQHTTDAEPRHRADIDNPEYWYAVSRACQMKAERGIPVDR